MNVEKPLTLHQHSPFSRMYGETGLITLWKAFRLQYCTFFLRFEPDTAAFGFLSAPQMVVCSVINDKRSDLLLHHLSHSLTISASDNSPASIRATKTQSFRRLLFLVKWYITCCSPATATTKCALIFSHFDAMTTSIDSGKSSTCAKKMRQKCDFIGESVIRNL